MHLTGVHGDHVPGFGLHLSASAGGELGAVQDDADAELIVVVFRKAPVGIGNDDIDAGENSSSDPNDIPIHRPRPYSAAARSLAVAARRMKPAIQAPMAS